MGHALTGLLATATSLLTTKLLFQHGLHFPMHLALLHCISILIQRLFTFLLSRTVSTSRPSQLYRSEPELDSLCEIERRIEWRWLHISCISGAILCGYQAIHHFSNLPTVVMIISLDWQSTSSPGFDQRNDLAKLLTLFVGATLILLLDFRPSLIGIAMIISTATCLFLAHHLRDGTLRSRKTIHSSAMHSQILSTFDTSTVGLLVTVAVAAAWCHFLESRFSETQTLIHLRSNLPILAVNLASSILSVTFESYIFCRSAEEHDSARGRGSLGVDLCDKTSSSITLVILTTIGSQWTALSDLSTSAIMPQLSGWQLIGFGVASLSARSLQHASPTQAISVDFLDDDCLCERRETIGEAQQTVGPEQCGFDHRKARDHYPRSIDLILLVALVSFYMIFSSNGVESSLSSSTLQSPHIDLSYRSDRVLDIVIARYEESASVVTKHIAELLSLSRIRMSRPNIIIYNKNEVLLDNSSFSVELAEFASARSLQIKTFSLPNIGRESDTYLEHITEKWDQLARHTLFMQAGVHYAPDKYLRHIYDYFAPNTGFLSLAPSGSFCSSCEPCFDHDWSEDPHVLNALFADFNDEVQCKDMVLTYRGQFIASAARIRGNDRSTYVRWLRELRDAQGRLHNLPYVASAWSRKKDSMSAPRVGFTIERMWGVIFQCNQRRIADRCPAFLSNPLCPRFVCSAAALEDCQCLDF